MVMILLNVTRHEDIGGALNIEENRKRTVMEAIDTTYLDPETQIQVILHEIFEDILEKGLSSKDITILMEENPCLYRIEREFANWDIDVIT